MIIQKDSKYFNIMILCYKKQARNINDMAKVNLKSEKTTPFGGIFHLT